MKRRLIVVAIIIVAISAYSGFNVGMGIREQYLEHSITVEHRRHHLADLRGCMYTMDSDAVRFILNPQKFGASQDAELKRIMRRALKCRNFIRGLGETTLDENISDIIGQVALFYSGYIDTVREILQRQVELTLLYEDLGTEYATAETMPRIMSLNEQQQDALIDTRRFLDRLELLISQAW